jgi:hypothetical protein
MNPGWYPDPDDDNARRYWDGETWSAPVLSTPAPALSDPVWSNTVPASPPASTIPSGFSGRQWLKVLAGFVVIVGVVITVGLVFHVGSDGVSGGGNGSGGGSTGGSSDAAKFAASATHDARVGARETTALLTEAITAQALDDAGSLYTVAADAKSLHDHLSDFKDTLYQVDGASDSAAIDFIEGVNDIKNSCGSVESWAGNPNAKSAVEWQTQMGRSIAVWNRAVRALWSKAGLAKPPVITIPS